MPRRKKSTTDPDVKLLQLFDEIKELILNEFEENNVSAIVYKNINNALAWSGKLILKNKNIKEQTEMLLDKDNETEETI